MITKIGGFNIRYELNTIGEELCTADRRHILRLITTGADGGELYIGDEIYGQWEIVPETENNPR